MPRLHKLQHSRTLYLGPNPPTERGQVCEAAQEIDLSDLPGRLAHSSCSLQQLPPQLREYSALDLSAPFLRGQNLRLILFQLWSRKPFGIHQRLLTLIVGRDRLGVRLGHFKVVAKDTVEAHLK